MQNDKKKKKTECRDLALLAKQTFHIQKTLVESRDLHGRMDMPAGLMRAQEVSHQVPAAQLPFACQKWTAMLEASLWEKCASESLLNLGVYYGLLLLGRL